MRDNGPKYEWSFGPETTTHCASRQTKALTLTLAVHEDEDGAHAPRKHELNP